MSAKKPLLPPATRWNTLNKTNIPTLHLENDDPQKYSQEAKPSPSGSTLDSIDRITLSSSPRSSRTLHTRWKSSDDLLEIKNTSTLPRSYEDKSPIFNRLSPPISPQNGSLVSDKPPIVPRKMQHSPQVSKAKPPLPRKPRTVYAGNRTGPSIPPKPRPPPTCKKPPPVLLKKTETPALTKNVLPEFKNSRECEAATDKPKLSSGLLKKLYSTDNSHPLAKNSNGNGPLELPNRDLHPHSKDFTDHVVVRRVIDKSLEKSLLKGKIASKQTASNSSLGSERPTSMIVASPVSTFYSSVLFP